jgi:hypothetical protein
MYVCVHVCMYSAVCARANACCVDSEFAFVYSNVCGVGVGRCCYIHRYAPLLLHPERWVNLISLFASNIIQYVVEMRGLKYVCVLSCIK